MSTIIKDPRLESFRNKLVKHDTIERALNLLLTALKQPRPESVIILVGPSGVGKSTIVHTVEKHLRKVYAQRMADDPGFLPYISMRAPAALDGHFNWRDMFTRALSIAGEVLIERKVVSQFEMELDGRKVDTLKGLVREELRRSLESLIRNRGVTAILLDEASALLRLKRGAIPFLQFEVLKSLAVELRIPIVLVGAYDLLHVLDGTGQLLRRSQIIHCPRYRFDAAMGRIDPEFTAALKALLGAIAIPQEPGLLENFDFFYTWSVGCVGVLKDWLDRALEAALAVPGGEPLLTREILKATALPASQAKRLVQEAKAGELKLIQEHDSELAKELDLDYTPSLDLPAPRLPMTGVVTVKTTGRRGIRGPSRDWVGGQNA